MKYFRPIAALVSAMALLNQATAQEEAGAVKNVQMPKPPRIVNRVAATVNGRPITANEVRTRLEPYLRELVMLYPRQGPQFAAELVKAKKGIINELIERELILSDFDTKGYSIPETAIEEEINRRVINQFNGKRERLIEMLQRSGVTYSEYRDNVRREFTASAMRANRYDADIPPTPDEIKEEYEATKSDYRNILDDEIRYRKIFIPVIPDEQALLESLGIPPTDPDFQEKAQAAAQEMGKKQLQLAEDLADKLSKGEVSFEDAAREYSRDPYAAEGGQWPTLTRKDLAVEFASIVFNAKPGHIIGPLMDPVGFTIVCVQNKKLAPAPPLSAPGIKDRVDDAVRRKQSEARYRQWIERLRDKALIRTFI